MAALQHSNSQSSLGTASAHSQDQGPGAQTVVIRDATATAPDPRAIAERAVRGAERPIKAPYLMRDDVGVMSVLCGNWGGTSRQVQQDIDYDLRSSPACILMMQEAQPELVSTLEALPTTPAMAGTASTSAVTDRATRSFMCLRGAETGNSLMVVARRNMVSERNAEVF